MKEELQPGFYGSDDDITNFGLCLKAHIFHSEYHR